MQNNRTNIKAGRAQAENRRRRRLRERMILLMLVTAYIVMAWHVKGISAQIRQMQIRLNRMETAGYGAAQTIEEDTDEKAVPDYVGSIGAVEVPAPVQRTWAETLEKLDQLGGQYPVIDEISQNSSLYPESMLTALANNPEMADYVAGFLNGSGNTVSGLTDAEKGQEFPLLLQWDPRWGYQPYGNSYIGVAGCGPTCLSMVLYYLTGDGTLTPDRIAAYAMENGYYVAGTGTAWALLKDFPPLYGVLTTEVKISEQVIRRELDRGAVLICAMGKGEFTVAGHFIVIYGYDDEGFKVNDPNCVARSRRRWAFHEMEGQIKSIWSFARQNRAGRADRFFAFRPV